MEKAKSKYCGCLFYSSNALSRLMTKMADEEFASTGLSSSYAFLLMSVHDKPGIQPKELSEQMQLTPSTVTRLIEKMEHRGLLSRESVGRCTEVYPTHESKKLNTKIKKAWTNLYTRYSEIIGVKASEDLNAKINIAMDKLS